MRAGKPPFAYWVVCQRKPDHDDSHGPAQFNLLYICGEGVATYQALYWSNRLTAKAVAVVRPGTGFGLNWTDFRDGQKALGYVVTKNPHGQPDYLIGEPGQPLTWESYPNMVADGTFERYSPEKIESRLNLNSKIMPWSNPVPCDLTRTTTRVSVPLSHADRVPALPGVCVIVRLDKSAVEERIMNIGETGNLQQRIAGGASHAPAQAIAAGIIDKVLSDKSKAIWMTTKSEHEALNLKRALITLFRNEFNKRPVYNRTGGNTANSEVFRSEYDALKEHVMSLKP